MVTFVSFILLVATCDSAAHRERTVAFQRQQWLRERHPWFVIRALLSCLIVFRFISLVIDLVLHEQLQTALGSNPGRCVLSCIKQDLSSFVVILF